MISIIEKKSRMWFSSLLMLIMGVILVPGCNEPTQNQASIDKPDINWGIGVYPPHGFTNANMDDWDDAFVKSRMVGKIAHLEVTYGDMSLEDAVFLYDIKVPRARENSMDVFMQINTFGSIPSNMTDFKNYCLVLAENYKPEYMCIGQEVNYVYDNNSVEAYNAFVSELLELYNEISAISPSTICLPSFAYEPMRANHQEILFDDFKEIVPFFPITSYPLKAFDIYPGYLYESPKDIPSDYWNVSDITDKDVFVTETGWSTDSSFRGSRQQQVDYVGKVYELVRNNPKVKKVVWILLMDVVEENTTIDGEYPGTMGFFTIDGEKKPAWRLIKD